MGSLKTNINSCSLFAKKKNLIDLFLNKYFVRLGAVIYLQYFEIFKYISM